MRLISLTANKKTFRPINFNRSGLTLIVGQQKNPDKVDSRKTYNGVGKSLAVSLVHFCLGSDTNKKLEEAIPDWEFNLKFELNGSTLISSRNTSNQKKITLDGEELTLPKFRLRLEEMVFRLPDEVKGVTFRSLIPRFIRPRKESYVSFNAINGRETDYNRLLCNGCLLGLDLGLITAKHDLKSERDRITSFRDNLNKDSVFREFFTDNKSVDIELKDLEEKITRLNLDLEKFKVADNYHQIEREAEDTKRSLQELKNNEVVISNAITYINKSLEFRPDISEAKLLAIYEEAKSALPDQVIKKLDEVTEFHTKLLRNRLKRLTAERSRLERALTSLRKEIAVFSRTRDSQLRFLGTHGALDDWVATSNYLADLTTKAQKIRDYKDLLQRYSDQTQEINIQLISETKKANTYLNKAKGLLDENMERFRSFSRKFYQDKPGGLTVKNNEGDNQTRFDIEAHIQDDASDGINEVKIFCFDLTVLTGRHNHDVRFLFHDSRLFSDMDPRQRATLFKIAYDLADKTGDQYIATLNEDQILSMKDQFANDEFIRIFSESTVLELTDDAPTSKLLGIQVDMQYEE